MVARLPSSTTQRSDRPLGVVRVLPLPEDGDPALVAALLAHQPSAADRLFRRYGEHVRRVLVRVLNADPETDDLVHDVFVDALQTLNRLKDPTLLRAWLTSIAIFKARSLIRRRRRRHWLSFMSADDLEQVPGPTRDPETADLVACTYKVLSSFPTEERIAFALHIIDGMELTEVAGALQISVATVKRRLRRAEDRFLQRVEKFPALRERLKHGGGARWNR